MEATVTVPSWVWGNNPAQFLREAELRAVPLGNDTDRWRVHTTERYSSRPSLVLVDTMSEPDHIRRRIGQLVATQAFSNGLEIDIDHRWNRAKQAEHIRDRPALMTELLSLSQIRTQIASEDSLASTVVEVQEVLASQLGTTVRVHVVRRTPEVLHRSYLPGLLLRQVHDPQARVGNIGAIRQANVEGKLVFSSSRRMLDGIALFDAYLNPMLAALTPGVWAFSAQRSFGTIIYTLGQPIRGTLGDSAEPLQMLAPPGGLHSLPVPTLSTEASTATIDWWARRLNDLFGVITDPAVFTDTAGEYSPAKHLQGLLTVEQLFRRVHSILTSHRDAHARRVLLFSTIDALKALTGRDLVKHCTLDFARQTLDKLREGMPEPVGEVLLPAAQRAVSALQDLQNGFFLGHDASGNHVTLTSADGNPNQMNVGQATAHYLDVLRNATHGFGTTKGNVERTNALLVHHDGNISTDLALLAYLYLLDVLTDMDRIRKTLYNKGITYT